MKSSVCYSSNGANVFFRCLQNKRENLVEKHQCGVFLKPSDDKVRINRYILYIDSVFVVVFNIP